MDANKRRATRASTIGFNTKKMTVPPAGGCSISKTTITKIAAPTARAIVAERGNNVELRWKNNKPRRPHARCPPSTFFGFDGVLSGIAKTMNEVEPIAAINMGSSISGIMNAPYKAAAARALCNR